MGDILFLAHRVPFPPDRGDRIRSFHIVKALAKLTRVHVVAFADDAADAAAGEGLRTSVASLTIVPRTRSRKAAAAIAFATNRPISLAAFESDAMRAAVAKLLAREPVDTIYAFSGQMAQFVPTDGARRFVMDFVDVDSAKFADYALRGPLPLRAVHAREARLLARFERDVSARADVSLFVSETEAALFRQRSGLGPDKVTALGNGIDLAVFSPDAGFARVPKTGPLILFTGQMDYRPNSEAVERFVRETLPAIRARVPGAGFAIVGRAPTSAVQALAAQPGVTVTGAVDDVRGWHAAADVVVAPLGIARGVQNKVLEAMAMGRAVVASPQAAEGIAARPDFDLLLATPQLEADVIATLLGDQGRRAELGRSARSCVEGSYSWHRQLAGLAALVGREHPGQTLRNAA